MYRFIDEDTLGEVFTPKDSRFLLQRVAPSTCPEAPIELCGNDRDGLSTIRFNGICEDGGPNSSASIVRYGSDCADCGTRTITRYDQHFEFIKLSSIIGLGLDSGTGGDFDVAWNPFLIACDGDRARSPCM